MPLLQSKTKYMKKILVLFGSPHTQGKTAALLKIYLKQYVKNFHKDFKINKLFIYNQNILPCTGCGCCIKSGICSQNKKDDVEKIFDFILNSNHIVVASPVYFSGFPSPLKAMVDRSQQLYNKKIKNGKIKNLRQRTGALVATCGSENKKGFAALESCCKQFFDCVDAAFSERLFASNTDSINNWKIYTKI